jgi:Predicted integral membrane protein
LLAGFSIAVIFAWPYEETPDGIVKTSEFFETNNKETSREGYKRKSNYFIPIGILWGLVIGVYGPKIINKEEINKSLPSEIQKLAILPFSNIRPENETDFLGYALSDEIINRLGYLKTLMVRPATAVRQYRGQEGPPEKVGEESEVNLILTGSNERNQERSRRNTELKNMSTKELIWQKSMTVNYDEIRAMQERVAG